jgi:serine/threonine protein kinase
MTSTLAPQIVLAGRYRLVCRLASGGMGQVWRAADEILGRPVAVKLLRSEYAEEPAFLERFRTEARRTAALSHGGIASVFDYGEVEEPDLTAYLVMELVDGMPLSGLLMREGRLDPERTLDVVAQASLALDCAHRAGVVHRDVKPSNLLIRRDGVVKVTDFGIAHATGEASQSETGMVVGTAAYLSPEQVVCRPATPASDVYALGVVAYECLAGRRPFTGEHPIALALAHHRHRPPPLPPDVPEPVRALVELAMAKDPQVRPPSAAALAHRALMTRASLLATRQRSANGSPGRYRPPAPGASPAPSASVALSASPPLDSLPGHNGLSASNGATGLNGSRSPNGWTGADVEQETGEWTPVSLLLTRAWSRSRRLRPVAVAAMLAVLSLLAVALTAATGQHAATIAVPSVDGQSIAEARQALARAGFEVRVRAQPDQFIRAGIIMAQEPAAGTRLARGDLVTLTVSSGPAGVTVDPARYLGKPLDAVRAALIRLGLRVSVKTGPPGGDPGTVVGIDPSGALRQGDGVTVTVAPPSRLQGWEGSAAAPDGAANVNDSKPSGRERVKKSGRDGKHGDRGGEQSGPLSPLL